MFEYKELETAKYWQEKMNNDLKLARKVRRQDSIGRFFAFAFFSTIAAVTYLYATGNLADVDVVGAIERIGANLPF